MHEFSDKSQVRDLFRRCGVRMSDEDAGELDFYGICSCLQRAILAGHVKIPSDVVNMSDPSDFLQQKVFQGPCPECKAQVVVTVEDMIDQNDDPSYCENGPIECNSCGCSWFLTKLCEGSPRLVDFREHKHSVDGGPELGECLGNGNYTTVPNVVFPSTEVSMKHSLDILVPNAVGPIDDRRIVMMNESF